MTRLRILHAIHDFLPRHRAGSEIYACALARAQASRHDVVVLAAEYDPAARHGTIRWREQDGLPVVELVNNWEFGSFDETYSSPRLNRQLEHVLEAVGPDVLHVHNLLNLTFDLPRLARTRGIAVVATAHDYTLVCASGGQRVHVAEAHVCETIDPVRCSRCFGESPFAAQMSTGRVLRHARAPGAARVAALLGRHLPALARGVVRQLPAPAIAPADVARRLARARAVFEEIDLFVAPSKSLADGLARLGLPRDRIAVSDYGFEPVLRRTREPGVPLRIGFVGTLVWHKGLHLLVDACRALRGEYRLDVFGDPAVFPDYSGALFRAARGLPVHFHGPFSAADTAAVYSHIDVLAVPSLWPENSPLVVHEAFIHGAPVVASRVGGIPELVTDGVNGLLFDPCSPDGLTRALQTLIDDRARVVALAAAAPPVKSIERDAAEWDVRYADLIASREGACAG